MVLAAIHWCTNVCVYEWMGGFLLYFWVPWKWQKSIYPAIAMRFLFNIHLACEPASSSPISDHCQQQSTANLNEIKNVLTLKHSTYKHSKLIISITKLAWLEEMLMHWAASDDLLLLLLRLVRAAARRRDIHRRDGHRFLRLHAGCQLSALVSFFPAHTLLSQQQGGRRKGGNSTFEAPTRVSFTFSPVLSASFSTHTRKFFVSIQPPVGELMRPVFLTENEFKKEQGEWWREWNDDWSLKN